MRFGSQIVRFKKKSLENAHRYTQAHTEVIVGTDLQRYMFNLCHIGFVALFEGNANGATKISYFINRVYETRLNW